MTQSQKSPKFDFAVGLTELEAITAWFESSDVDLTEALDKFERGMELAADLKSHLQLIENRVTKIKQRFDSPSSNTAIAPIKNDDSEDLEPMDLFKTL